MIKRIVLLTAILFSVFSCGTAGRAARQEDATVSPTTLIILYDPETGKDSLLQAVREYGAELISDYGVIPGIAIRIPAGTEIEEAVKFFSGIKGVTSVERDHIYHVAD